MARSLECVSAAALGTSLAVRYINTMFLYRLQIYNSITTYKIFNLQNKYSINS